MTTAAPKNPPAAAPESGELVDGHWRRSWRPEGAARANVVLVHGYGEHSGRYDHVGRALAAAGLAVYTGDLTGHGRTLGRRGYVASFDEYCQDVDRLMAWAQEKPARTFLLGHSMGGLVASTWLLGSTARSSGEAAVKGLVMTSPFFGLKLPVPAIKRAAGVVASKIWPTLAMPAGLLGSDLTRDPAMVADHDADPLNNTVATARWFTEATTAQARLLERAPTVTLPVLCLVGAADRVADPAATEAVFAAFGSKDKTIDLKTGQFHELFNEPEVDRRATIAEVVAWVERHLVAAP